MPQAMALVREAGAEPIPGYRLVEPLGQGGFGEVWKCEAPGGLFKAIKFVGHGEDGASPAEQELAALQRVKTIRHPFILSLERIEVIEGVLVILMELADRSLHAVHEDQRAQGQPGIPRDELLAYLIEAAEALDQMNFEHGLQHLDVKPHNLFVVSNHIKVADFGLVHSLGSAEGDSAPRRNGGVTPLYASPEILRGTLSRHSDQYSLAIVYQQLLSGTVPFWDETVHQLVLKHLSAEPDLSAMLPCDKSILARALAKAPEERFPSCTELVHALLEARPAASSLRSSGMWRRVLAQERQDSEDAPSLPLAPSPRASEITRATPPGSLTPTRAEPHRPNNPTAETPCAGARTVQGPPLNALAGQPTSVSLPGHRFLQCLSQTPLGDFWRARNAAGRECRALCLLEFVRYDEHLIQHLRALTHPALPPTEVHWSPAERLVLVTECCERALRDRFENCLAEGRSGAPREELLRYLRTAAEALDALHEQFGLRHLGLHPRNLFVQDGRLWFADFGVIELVWLPTGQAAGPLNARYAAPELFEQGDYNAADQYSLALIYAEMLTGAHPRPQRQGLGQMRRSGDRRSGGARLPPIDLTLLPQPDRDVVARALDASPPKRYPNCRAFVDALESAAAPSQEDLYRTLPPVIPFTSLFGEPPAPDVVLPSPAQFVTALLRVPVPCEVAGAQNVRYRVHPDGTWEYCCPVQLLPCATRLKVDGFRQHWNGSPIEEAQGSFRFHIDLQAPRRFWERVVGQQRRIEVHLRVGSFDAQRVRLTEAHARLRPLGGEPDRMASTLADLAPQLFDSLRSYLQASTEQRAEERRPFAQPLRIYPVLPDLELGEAMEAVGRNISSGGIGFRVAKLLPSEKLYLHFHQSAHAELVVLAHVMRFQSNDEGGLDVGAFFPGPSAEG